MPINVCFTLCRLCLTAVLKTVQNYKKKMKRPKFEPIFSKKSDFCEKTNKKPISDFIPHQAITLKELVTRFERGQRLNVHSNFAPGSNFEAISDEDALERIKSESMETDDFPPIAHDIVDVELLKREHDIHKCEFNERINKKKEEAQQAAKQAQQAPSTPLPDSHVA